MFFFHRKTVGGVEDNGSAGDSSRSEDCAKTCQWAVPPTWEGDPLANEALIASEDNSFVEPAETWLPSSGKGLMGEELDTHSTPGVKPKPAQRAKKGDVVGPIYPSAVHSNSVLSGAARSTSAELDEGAGAGAGAGSTRGTLPGGGLEGIGADADRTKSEKDIAKLLPRDANRDRDMKLLRRLAGSSDDLLELLARRLGVSGAGESGQEQGNGQGNEDAPATPVSLNTISSVATSTTATESVVRAPRLDSKRKGGDDVDSDEDVDSDVDWWSDDDEAAGDWATGGNIREQIGELPQSHGTAKALRKKQWEDDSVALRKEQKKISAAGGTDQHRVPFLLLNAENKTLVADGADVPIQNGPVAVTGGQKGVRGLGWRKLPRPDVPPKFFLKCTQTHTLGPDDRESNLPNSPLFMAPISPVDACVYEPMPVIVPIETIFIANARADLERVLATVERNIKREEELSQTLSTAELLERGVTPLLTDDYYVAQKFGDDKNVGASAADRMANFSEQAILAAKSLDLAQLEDALEEKISIETSDQFGNTLLILAAQQVRIEVFVYILVFVLDVKRLSSLGCLSITLSYL